MKIAVIMFGQPRFVDNPNCYESQKEHIFSQGDVDVFAHLWHDNEKHDYPSSSWSGMEKCPASEKDLQTFIEKWKPVNLLTEKPRLIEDRELFNDIKKKFPDPYWTEEDFNKCLSHLYSLEKSIELFESFVEKTKTNYDFVITLRTDICVWEYPRLEDLDKDSFYVSSIFHPEHFADLTYVMNPKYVDSMKAYSYLTDKNREILVGLFRPCAEQFKKANLIKKGYASKVRGVPLPVRVVRDMESKGTRW